jgi:hypothetical protein
LTIGGIPAWFAIAVIAAGQKRTVALMPMIAIARIATIAVGSKSW